MCSAFYNSIVKKRLIDVLQAFLDPIRTKRAELAKDPTHVFDILKKGTAQAESVAQATLSEVRKAMCLDCF